MVISRAVLDRTDLKFLAYILYSEGRHHLYMDFPFRKIFLSWAYTLALTPE